MFLGNGNIKEKLYEKKVLKEARTALVIVGILVASTIFFVMSHCIRKFIANVEILDYIVL